MKDDDLLIHKLNLETSLIAWTELQRQFAGGRVIIVKAPLDLLYTAETFSKDDSAQVKQWIESEKIEMVSDTQAKRWFTSNAELWAVVVRPWVLVQEPADS